MKKTPILSIARVALVGLSSVMTADLAAETYPYSLPSSFNATININTNSTIWSGDLLLGMNQKTDEIITTIDAPSYRGEAEGVWANFYDWRPSVDGVRRYDDYPNKNSAVDLQSKMETFERNNMKIDAEGLFDLQNSENFDLLFTFGLNHEVCHSSNETKKHIQHIKDHGVPVKAIEIGNELWSKIQRSYRTETSADCFSKMREAAWAIDDKDSSIKTSIPLWHTLGSWTDYNETITASTSYYDVISLHSYHDSIKKDNPTPTSSDYKKALTAGKELMNRVNVVRSYGGGRKKIWLSEFGCNIGPNRAAGSLGLADMYIKMLNNPSVFERAHTFGAQTRLYTKSNGRWNPTVYGKTYQFVRNAVQGARRYSSIVSTHNLESGSKAVEATACVKNGKIRILAVNKTNKSVYFLVKENGSNSSKTFTHDAQEFSSLGTKYEKSNGYRGQRRGNLTLPPYSINLITQK